MSRNKIVRYSIIGTTLGYVVGCAVVPHQTPLVRQVSVPLLRIETPPQGSVIPPGNSSIPIFTPLSTSSPPVSTIPADHPLDVSTSPPTPTSTLSVAITFPEISILEPPTTWVEGLEGSELVLNEREAPQKPFLEEAHLISIESLSSLSGSKAVSVRVSADAPTILSAHLIRRDRYGSFDHVGLAQIDTVASKATFTATQLGEYLIGGNETYSPTNLVNVPVEGAITEAVAFDSNSADISPASLQSIQRRRVASVVLSPHVKNYLKEQNFVLRPVILFLHGMGERDPRKLWSNIATYLKTSAPNKEDLKGTVFYIPTYDTLQAVHVSKERLKQQLFQTVGSVPIIIVCHSMGCLAARDFAADPDLKDLVVGGVMLAGANGSPWVPKKRMRLSISDQPDATTLLTAQTLALTKTMPNFIESIFSSKPLPSLVANLDNDMTSKGMLSLATARADIPTRTYTLRLNIGIYPAPLKETLSEDDIFTLPCTSQYFPQTPRDTRIHYGSCYANFVRELRTWERQQGLDIIPRWYAYAGYFRGNELRLARETFLKRLVSPEAIARFLSDKTEPLDEEALRFAASLLADRITKDGVSKRLSDGLVDPEDAWLLEDGPSLESVSSRRDSLSIDPSIVRQRLPKDVIATREFFRSHRQIVFGLTPNDDELFGSIARDVGVLLNTYRSQVATYGDGELDNVRSEIKQLYHNIQGVYDSSGKTTAVLTTTVQFRSPTSCGQPIPCVDIPFDVIRIVDDWQYYKQTTTILSRGSRRAYRVWHAWRLYDE